MLRHPIHTETQILFISKMKFLIVAALATVLPAIEGAANFKSTINTASNQMTSLAFSLDQIQSVADSLGHTQISAKCNEAKSHLKFARSSWGGISSLFGNSPWRAGFSPQGQQCQSRLSSCGSCLNWIYRQPQISSFPQYRPHISSCQRGYTSCQSSCGLVWKWPCPPSWKPPTPSQWYRRQRRDDSPSLCPAKETACPISSNSTSHECVDTQTEITSCGGCESLNEGENCLTIEGADEVGCERGYCRVFSVLPGYVINEDNGRPAPKSS